MEHSLEEKLKAIKMYNRGVPPTRIAKILGFSRNVIAVWCELFKNEGIVGLQRLPYNCRYNFEEKCQIVCEIEKNHVPLHVVSAKYHVSRSTLHCWVSVVRRKGYDALKEVKYGRKYGKNHGIKHTPMGRPKKKEPMTEMEKLQRENELLRAENAYLKKLRALMTEKASLSPKSKH